MEQKEQEKLLTLPQIKDKWNKLAPAYSHFDQSMNIFFYQLVQVLRLSEAKNIYEVGCGLGRLVPLIMGIKNKNASFLAVDISEKIVEMAKENLRQFFSTIPGKVDEEAYYKLNKLRIQVSQGQKTIQTSAPFDRILCNLVLMLTEDPQEMMKTFHKQATSECLLGVTVTGNTDIQNYLHEIPNRIRQKKGISASKSFKNHVLYDCLEELGNKTGWQLLVTWQQQIPFSFVQVDSTLRASLTQLWGQDSEIMQEVLEQIGKIFKKKEILCFPGKMAIFRRK